MNLERMNKEFYTVTTSLNVSKSFDLSVEEKRGRK